MKSYRRSADLVVKFVQASTFVICQVRRRGLQRYVSIIVDGSKAMSLRDLQPSRMEMVLSGLHNFIPEFFEQNPISQIQLISARDGLATAITPLSGKFLVVALKDKGNPQHHLSKLEQCVSVTGDLSLKNALSIAIASLRLVVTEVPSEVQGQYQNMEQEKF